MKYSYLLIIIVLIGLVKYNPVKSQNNLNNQDIVKQCLSKVNKTQTFEEAKDDANIQEECEQINTLIPISKNNSDLDWQENKVLVLAWVKSCQQSNLSSIACGKEGIQVTIPENLDWAYWITAVPEVKNFLASQSIPLPQLEDRLKQYLGLDTKDKYDLFVEIWVDKNNLIRPCIDTEIDDTKCNLINNQEVSNPFRNARKSKWPFTGLGYTYDWGSNESDVGASEFVIKGGSTIEIKRIVTTDNYITESQYSIIPGERVGKVTMNTSRDELTNLFPANMANVEDVEVPLGEGMTTEGTKVEMGNKNKFTIIWNNKEKSQVDKVVDFGSAWYLPEGIHLGMKWEDLQDKLGEFQLFGFRWDYGGTLQLQGTPLEKYQDYLIIRVAPSLEAISKNTQALNAVSGERLITSTNPNLEFLDLRVTEIIVILK